MARPTTPQIYALAAALCERMGEEFPATRDQASAVIERLRTENGHPAPTREDTLLRPRRRRRAGGTASDVAARLVDEMD